MDSESLDQPPVCVGCGTAAVSGVSAGIPTVTSAAGDAFGDVQSAVTGIL